MEGGEMKLRDFISETIEEIAFGVHKAKVNCSELIAVSPGNMNGDSVVKLSEIEFDVAVTVEESKSGQKSADGSAKANVSVLGVGIEGAIGGTGSTKQDASSSKVSRVAFKVPVYLNAHMRNDPTIDEERDRIRDLEQLQ
jgi:hypothetical protein